MPGEGGLITFPQSSWLASIVIPYQPHFIGQPEDVSVLWGYGLFVDKSPPRAPRPRRRPWPRFARASETTQAKGRGAMAETPRAPIARAPVKENNGERAVPTGLAIQRVLAGRSRQLRA